MWTTRQADGLLLPQTASLSPVSFFIGRTLSTKADVVPPTLLTAVRLSPVATFRRPVAKVLGKAHTPFKAFSYLEVWPALRTASWVRGP